MTGFVWLKTITGKRTTGFFALQANDGKLYTSDGINLQPPLGSVMVIGDEMITTIKKSSPKGMYVYAWKATSAQWCQYVHNTWKEHLHSYAMVNHTILNLIDTNGVPSPHNASKEVIAQKRANVKRNKDKIERDFKDNIHESLQDMKSMTVRARAAALAGTCPRRHLSSLTPAGRDGPRPRSRAQSGQLYRFYRKATEEDEMNTKFMVENRLTRIIFPKMNTNDKITEIWPQHDEWEEYLKLCTKLNITPPSEMQVKMCQHYVKKKNGKVIAGTSIMTTNINNSNKRTCVSIEVMVSIQKGSASIFLDIVSKNLKKRAGMSYMVTQALDTPKASAFWNKHMSRHREADALAFMFFMLDNRYKLFEGTTNLRTTY